MYGTPLFKPNADIIHRLPNQLFFFFSNAYGINTLAPNFALKLIKNSRWEYCHVWRQNFAPDKPPFSRTLCTAGSLWKGRTDYSRFELVPFNHIRQPFINKIFLSSF